MAGVLSLNGTFTYPIELLKTLVVDDTSTFKKSIAIGSNSSVNGNGFANGDNNFANGAYSNAVGSNNTTNGKYSTAIGSELTTSDDAESSIVVGTSAKTTKKYSFVWSGVYSQNNNYTDSDEGQFRINPKGGDSGFYIGELSFPNIVNSYATSAVQSNSNTFTKQNTFINGIVSQSGNVVIASGSFQTNESVVATFNGDVNVPDQPESDNSSHSANTRFVKYAIDKCVKTDGGSMTGKLTLDGDPTDSLHAATKQYVDNKSIRITNGTTEQTIQDKSKTSIDINGKIYTNINHDGILVVTVSSDSEDISSSVGIYIGDNSSGIKIGELRPYQYGAFSYSICIRSGTTIFAKLLQSDGNSPYVEMKLLYND